MSLLRQSIEEAVKTAMREQNKPRLGALRLITAAIKQKEVDERVVITDAHVLAILDKMSKQRRESIAQYEKAERQDLVDQETFELSLIQTFLPKPLTTEEIDAIIEAAITKTSATSLKDMAGVMALVKPELQGKADMSVVSSKLKERLSS